MPRSARSLPAWWRNIAQPGSARWKAERWSVNMLRRLRPRSTCCGHPGEPGTRVTPPIRSHCLISRHSRISYCSASVGYTAQYLYRTSVCSGMVPTAADGAFSYARDCNRLLGLLLRPAVSV